MKTFKNWLCFSLIAMSWLQADMLDNFTKAINSYTTKKLNEIKDQVNSANPTKNRNTTHNANGMLTNIDCKVLKNNFYSVCYSSELKNPIYGVSVLFGDLVDKNNIEKRYEFKTDTRLAKYQQATTQDYTRSGFDRGHFVANDASFDFASNPLRETYRMTNITPEAKNTNRHSVLLVEKEGRNLARKYHQVLVEELTIIKQGYRTFSSKNIAIPSGFWYHYDTSLTDSYENTKSECFYIPNDNQKYLLQEMRKDCKEYERVEKQVVFKNNKNTELNELPKYLNNAKKY
ncbi:DNA/RNA non-specific endonuclease [Helicobacter pylori]|nr:DNA/RNA non-specific endonuclease [Helicobacter pylori]